MKRLAVQTEDHPLAYGGFEGRIPDGEYGAGDSLIWDRGTYDTVPPGAGVAQRKKGHLHLGFDGEKLKGEWHLVRTRGPRAQGAVAALQGEGRHAEKPAYDVVAERPESVVSGRRRDPRPGAARSAARAARRARGAAQARTCRRCSPRWWRSRRAGSWTRRGEVRRLSRALARSSNGRVALWTRNALDLNGALSARRRGRSRGIVVGDAVIDGEIVRARCAGRVALRAPAAGASRRGDPLRLRSAAARRRGPARAAAGASGAICCAACSRTRRRSCGSRRRCPGPSAMRSRPRRSAGWRGWC